MKKIIPNIVVENCKEALKYYQAVFGGEEKNIQLADGKEMFKGLEGKIIHSELHVNEECILYFGDVLEGRAEQGNIHLILDMDGEEEINRIYEVLSKDGKVKFPLQKTFWGATHAVVSDCYGVLWSLNFAGK